MASELLPGSSSSTPAGFIPGPNLCDGVVTTAAGEEEAEVVRATAGLKNGTPAYKVHSRSARSARLSVSIDLTGLLAQDDYFKKLSGHYFRSWRNKLRLLRRVATLHAAKKKLAFEIWKDATDQEWNKMRRLSIRVHRKQQEERRRNSYFVPIAFQRWCFVRRLRLQLELPLPLAWTPLQIKKEWRLWVRDNRKLEKKMDNLWLQLGTATLKYIAKKENKIRKNIRTRQLRNPMRTKLLRSLFRAWQRIISA